MQTLDAAQKQAIQQCGVNLTPTMEHLAAQTTIDWTKLIGDLGQFASAIIPLILALLSDIKKPTQPQNMATAHAGSCDHYVCCCAVLKSILHSAKLAAEHCCQCCEGGYG